MRKMLYLLGIFAMGGLNAYETALASELKSMCEKDQDVRFQIIQSGKLHSEEGILALQKIDRENLPRLKAIVEQWGWPGFQLVGEEGEAAMWLLVQHCDADVEFQRVCLKLLKEAVLNGDASKKHCAYLEDRVLVHGGLSQLYGTQVLLVDGEVVLNPVQDPEELDRRREEMGLNPLNKYLDDCREIYGLKR